MLKLALLLSDRFADIHKGPDLVVQKKRRGKEDRRRHRDRGEHTIKIMATFDRYIRCKCQPDSQYVTVAVYVIAM